MLPDPNFYDLVTLKLPVVRVAALFDGKSRLDICEMAVIISGDERRYSF
jgi:hypothetical protein